MKTKLLAVVGSQRENGNSYSLARRVLESVDVDWDIIQSADRRIEFCSLCEECKDQECVLEDDLNEIPSAMRSADGLVFSVPKQLDAPSKFLALLERLATIVHVRRHMGHGGPVRKPDYKLFSNHKPFCLFALSGARKIKKETLQTVVDYIEFIGLTLISHDDHPFIAVSVRAGDERGEVLRNKAAIEQCRGLVQKLILSATAGQPAGSPR